MKAQRNNSRVKRQIFRLIVNILLGLCLAVVIAAAMYFHSIGYFLYASILLVIAIYMSFYWLQWDARAKADIDMNCNKDCSEDEPGKFTGI